MLLHHGANVNFADKDGRTPLWIASAEGNAEIVRILLDRGADPSIADNKGNTPILKARTWRDMHAIHSKYHDIFDMLAQHGQLGKESGVCHTDHAQYHELLREILRLSRLRKQF